VPEPGRDPAPPQVGPPLVARHPLSWLAVFGPGAIVASLTIGTGELVFSARAGSAYCRVRSSDQP